MILERFNVHGKVIDFNPARGIWNETDTGSSNSFLNGVGDLIGESCVAIARGVANLELFIGQAKFDLDDPLTGLNYRHQEDGTTIFSAHDNESSAEIRYPSWWKTSPQTTVVFGSAADEDEDICAYIIFMISAAPRKSHLLRKFVAYAQ